MKRILFPTDFSELTRNALAHAVQIARISDAELILVNAFNLEYLDPHIPKESYEMERDESLKKLEGLKEELLGEEGNAGVKIRCFPVFGSPVSSIEELAEHQEADLIVMATNGASGLKAFFTGSHTERVVDRVNCPVLVVPEKAELRRIAHVLFASDLTKTPEKELGILMQIVRAAQAELHIVNVGEGEEKAVMEKAAEKFEKEELYEDIPHHWEFVEHDDVLKGIEAYIDEHPEIDMLVMVGRERRDWLERFVSPQLTKKAVHHPFLPTMIVKH